MLKQNPAVGILSVVGASLVMENGWNWSSREARLGQVCQSWLEIVFRVNYYLRG